MQAAGMVGRVRQEVAIHSRLKHPAVLELYTFFEDANYVYLVLELCHNGELQRFLKLQGSRALSEEHGINVDKFTVLVNSKPRTYCTNFHCSSWPYN